MTQATRSSMMDYDIVVGGGGVTGIYLAYRLSRQYPKHKILLLESADRLGGRILTEHVGNFILEYGAMRFTKLNTKLMALLKELDISLHPCPPVCRDNNKQLDYSLLIKEEVDAISKGNSASPKHEPNVALEMYAARKLVGDQWNNFSENLQDPATIRLILEHSSFEGTPLSHFKYVEVMQKVLSDEAFQYCLSPRDVNDDATSRIYKNICNQALSATRGAYFIKEGSEEIIRRMLKKMGSNVTIYTKVMIDHLQPNHEHINVKVSTKNHSCPKSTFTCVRLILATHLNGLRHITGLPLSITRHYDELHQIALYKVFAIVSNPPWNETNIPMSRSGVKDERLLCDEVHYFYDAKTGEGMVLMYHNANTPSKWEAFCQQEVQDYPESNGNPELKEKLVGILNVAVPGYLNPEIIHYGIRNWYLEPFRAGVHRWKPESDPPKTIEAVQQFNLEGIDGHKVHICGETFTHYPGHVEGCLSSADNVLQIINDDEQRDRSWHEYYI